MFNLEAREVTDKLGNLSVEKKREILVNREEVTKFSAD